MYDSLFKIYHRDKKHYEEIYNKRFNSENKTDLEQIDDFSYKKIMNNE